MNKAIAITDEIVIRKIYQIRDKKVMLDRDLAELYGVETKVLKPGRKKKRETIPNRFYVPVGFH